MARGVGIEINGTRVRALVVEGGKKPRILSYTEQAIIPDAERPWEERTRDAIKAAVAKVGGLRGKVSASIDTGDVIMRELQLPFKGDDQIRKTIRFELESLVHNYAIEDLVVDFIRTSETEKGTQLLVAGVPRKLIQARLKLMESAGVDPAMLDLDSTALFNALTQCGAVEKDDPFLVVYGCSRFTKILLIENRKPRAIRTIRFAVDNPPPPLEFSTEEPAKGKTSAIVVLTASQWDRVLTAGTPESNELVEILAREISRFLLASAGSVSPTHIFLAGDLNPDVVADPLSKATGVPVTTFDFLARIDNSLGKDPGLDRQIPVPLGLALKSVEMDASGIDFRRDEFSYSKKFDVVKSTAMVTVYLILMFLGLVTLHHYFQSDDLEKELVALRGWQVEVAADAVNHDPNQVPEDLKKDPSLAVKWLKEKHSDMERAVGAGDHPIERSALDLAAQLWRAFAQFYGEFNSKRLEDQAFFASIDNVAVRQNPSMPEDSSIVIEGFIRNPSFGNELKKKLTSVEPFNAGWKVESGAYSAEKDNVKFQFTLKKEKAVRK